MKRRLHHALLFAALVAQAAIADSDAKIEVVSSSARSATLGPAENFTGQVQVEQLFAAERGRHVSGGRVTFRSGARSAWHSHPRARFSSSPPAPGAFNNGVVRFGRSRRATWCGSRLASNIGTARRPRLQCPTSRFKKRSTVKPSTGWSTSAIHNIWRPDRRSRNVHGLCNATGEPWAAAHGGANVAEKSRSLHLSRSCQYLPGGRARRTNHDQTCRSRLYVVAE